MMLNHSFDKKPFRFFEKNITTIAPVSKRPSAYNIGMKFAIVGVIWAGTGGSVNPNQGYLNASTIPVALERARREEQAHNTQVGMSKILTSLKYYLSLRVNDLANVLKVERPTIYAWQSGQTPKAHNLERIAKIEDLAMFWKDLNPQPMGVGLKLKSKNSKSVLELLSEDELRIKDIKQAMQFASDKIGHTKTATAVLSPIEDKIRSERFFAVS